MFRRLFLAAISAAAALHALPASAQEFPKKQPIRLVVSSSAGGLTDTMGRIYAEFLQRRLGQAVVVENRVGASGAIGADFVAKAAPDGHTIFLAGAELAVLPAVRSNLPYKFDEFTYLVRPFMLYPLMLAGPKFPVNSVQELVANMKANPGRVRYGSTGVGAIVHMGSAMFEGAAGVKGVHVPFPGIAPIYQEMLAGNIDFVVGGSNPFPEGLKVLASAGSRRSPVYPNVPTLDELGVKGAGWDVWFGFIAPPSLPKPIADRLIAELTAIGKDPEAIAKFQTATKLSPEAAPLTGEEFRRRAVEDNRGWKTTAEREKVVVQQ